MSGERVMRSPHFYYAHLALYNIWYLVYYNNCKEVIPKGDLKCTKLFTTKKLLIQRKILMRLVTS